MISSKSHVTFREINAETVLDICDLSVDEKQSKFVAKNVVSIAQAYFSESAWFRGIYAEDTPVGFIMLDIRLEASEVTLWRFMIDAQYQKHGFGRLAMNQLFEYVSRLADIKAIITGVVPGEGGPQGFYEKARLLSDR